MLSVLLLSEDQDVLDDLRGALAEHQAMMTHTATTQSALTFLGERTFDIIFVDMDGAGPAFLALAKQRQPEATRIVVSGPVGRNTAMRSLPLANESLAKPCSSKILDRSIKRACNLQALKRGEEIKRLIASVRELPSLPSNLVALNEALLQEDSSLQEVASVVARDVAMSAKILRLVNSSSFGLRSRVENLGQAVAYLGVDNIRNLAFVTEAFRAFVPGAGLPSDWMSRFTDHSLAVSRIAAQVVNSRSAQYEATVVGMLHDVGKLVVADRLLRQSCSPSGPTSTQAGQQKRRRSTISGAATPS